MQSSSLVYFSDAKKKEKKNLEIIVLSVKRLEIFVFGSLFYSILFLFFISLQFELGGQNVDATSRLSF